MPISDPQETVTQPACDTPGRAPLPDGLLCPDCAYDLRGLTSDRCPECGFDIAPLRRQESLLPWRRRREIGWLRGFWQTFWLVSAHPRRLAIEIVTEQPPAEARRFWLVAYLHLMLAFAAVVVALTAKLGARRAFDLPEEDAWLVGGLVFTVPIWLWQLPGLAMYMLQSHRVPEQHERRTWALSIYVWAILLWVLPGAACCLIAIGISGRPGSGAIGPAFALAALCFAVPPAVFIQRRLYVVCRRLLHVGRLAAAVRIVGIQAAAIALLVVLLLFPAGIYFLVVVYWSLQ